MSTTVLTATCDACGKRIGDGIRGIRPVSWPKEHRGKYVCNEDCHRKLIEGEGEPPSTAPDWRKIASMIGRVLVVTTLCASVGAGGVPVNVSVPEEQEGTANEEIVVMSPWGPWLISFDEAEPEASPQWHPIYLWWHWRPVCGGDCHSIVGEG